MANTPTLVTSGTQTATIGTKHLLYTTTAGGVFVMQVDANALASTEILNLYIETKTLSSGTLRGTYFNSFTGALSVSDCTLISVPIALTAGVEVDFSLQQTSGTGRAFLWEIIAL